jgi:hypothetical protein
VKGRFANERTCAEDCFLIINGIGQAALEIAAAAAGGLVLIDAIG